MRIIPAIDIINGQCVRLTKGVFDQKKVYAFNPLEVAKLFESHGLEYLHLVDLDGAKNGQVQNLKVLENICTNTHLKVDFGGGIRTLPDIQSAFDAGASQVNCGSIAVKEKMIFQDWLGKFGSERIILSADVLDQKVAIRGWQEKTQLDINMLIKPFLKDGLKYVTCTDISKDGMLQGPAKNLYVSLVEDFPNIKFVASGGISTIDEILAIQAIGVDGVIIGKAIYEDRIQLKELAELC